MKDNIQEVLKEEGIDAKVITKDALNYAMPILEKLYAEINPNITTQVSGKQNIVYFNTNVINDNAYLHKLVDVYTNASATHSNLINLKRNLLIGEGLIPVVSGDTATQEFIDHFNNYGQNLQEIWEKICFDYALAEAYALQVIYNANGKITDCYHQDITTVRAKANADYFNSNTETWYLSQEWAKITNAAYRRYNATTYGQPINNFNPKSFAGDGGKQLLYVKRYTANNGVYAIPSYQSILPYVELDLQLSKYHLNKVSSGFFPTVIVSLVGSPSDEEKQQFVNKFKNKYVGSDKEKLLFIWSEEISAKPEIIPFNTNDEAQVFEILNKILTQKIASGHGANPELAGIQSEAGASLGGDSNKLAVSYNYFVGTVIVPMQKAMLVGINKIMKINGLGEVTVNTPVLNIDNNVGQNKVKIN